MDRRFAAEQEKCRIRSSRRLWPLPPGDTMVTLGQGVAENRFARAILQPGMFGQQPVE